MVSHIKKQTDIGDFKVTKLETVKENVTLHETKNRGESRHATQAVRRMYGTFMINAKQKMADKIVKEIDDESEAT